MKVLIRIMGKTKFDRIRNDKIRMELNQTPITQRIVEKQLQWYGHVRRMHKTRKPKQYMEARPEGKRMRGRQRRTYLEIIEQHGRVRGKTLREMYKMTTDRQKWKAFSRTHPTP